MPRVAAIQEFLRRRSSLRQALLAGFGLLLVGVFIWRNHSGFSSIPGIAQQADPNWITAAFLCEVVALVLIVGRSRLITRRLGYQLGWWTLTRAHLRRKAVSAVVPGGGAPAAVLYARDLARVNVTADDAVYSIALNGLTGTIGTIAVLLPLLLLPMSGSFGILELALLFCFLACSMGAGLMLCQARWIPARLTSRLPRRGISFLDSVRAHEIRLRDLVVPIQLAIVSNAAGTIGLYASLRAVHQHPPFATLMATRAVGNLSGHLAPVFQGSGLVEGSMTTMLHHAGTPVSLALAGTLLFRVVQVWLPVAIGLAMLPTYPTVSLRRFTQPAWGPVIGLATLSLLVLLPTLMWTVADVEGPWFVSASGLPAVAAVALTSLWLRSRRRIAAAPVVAGLPHGHGQ